MIASRRSWPLSAALLAGLALAGCRTPSAPPAGRALERDPHFASRVPDVADHTAAQLARGALLAGSPASDRKAAHQAMDRLEAIDLVLQAAEEPATGLAAVSQDVTNATLDDPRAYRIATRELLERSDLEPDLRRRLEQFAADDPLALANARLRDARRIVFADAFNTLAEPLGRSLMTTALAPYRLGNALLQYAVKLYTREPLPLQRRQALSHWKRFLRRHPDAAEAPDLRPRVRRAEERWNRTQRGRALRAAKRALRHGEARLALVYADRARRVSPEDTEASGVLREAQERVLQERERHRRSLGAPGDGVAVAPPGARALGVALLHPAGALDATARELLESDPDSPLADEARFALALARGEAGEEGAMWEELEALAKGDSRASNMARHARALVAGNAHGAFVRARRRTVSERLRWVLLGPWSRGIPDRGLPRPVEGVLALPSLLQTVVSTPLRLIRLPFAPPPPSSRAAAVHARHYLELHPDGEHAQEVRDWLESFEARRGNWFGALKLAEGHPEADPERLAELREKAANQALEVAQGEKRRDLRNTLYRRIAREFPATQAGRAAGRLARAEVEGATAQRIRMTRGFLLENQRVAGPHGLGLKPGLLDGDLANGELHEEGVALLGGREIELAFVGASGDEEGTPTRVRESLSEAQLARLVSELEEMTLHNELVDPDDELGADAQRDVFLERARLGLAGQIDPRATAESRYTYRGLRERYGVVRSREPILPFDLVLQGSLSDLSLGAFPRLRKPRETPDAFLYE